MNKVIVFLLGFLLTQPALADTKINNLSGGAAVSGTDIFPVYQGANPATGVTAAQIKTFANGSAVDARTTTSEAILNSDQNKLVTFSNGSAVACTIAQAGAGGNFAAGWAVSLRNLGAGTVTCTATTSKIDGSGAGGSFTLTTGQGLDLYSDGTDYFTQSGKGSSASPGGSSGQLQTNNGSGGFGAVAAPSGAVVGTTDSQTLTNKSIAASEINSGTLAAAQMPALTGDCVTSAGAVATTCPNVIVPAYTADANTYFSLQNSGNFVAGVLTVNRLYMIPVVLPAGYALTSIVVPVTTGQAGGSGYLGLYDACFSTSQSGCGSAGYGQPRNLLASGTTTAVALTASTTRVSQSITFTTTYTGLHWIALVATASGTMPSVNQSSTIFAGPLGLSINASATIALNTCIFRAFTFPTGVGLNSTETGNTFTTAAGTGCPMLGVR